MTPKFDLTDSDRASLAELSVTAKTILKKLDRLEGAFAKINTAFEKHLTLCQLSRERIGERLNKVEDSDITHRRLFGRVEALERNMVDLSEFEDKIEVGRRFWCRRLVAIILTAVVGILSSIITTLIITSVARGGILP